MRRKQRSCPFPLIITSLWDGALSQLVPCFPLPEHSCRYKVSFLELLYAFCGFIFDPTYSWWLLFFFYMMKYIFIFKAVNKYTICVFIKAIMLVNGRMLIMTFISNILKKIFSYINAQLSVPIESPWLRQLALPSWRERDLPFQQGSECRSIFLTRSSCEKPSELLLADSYISQGPGSN